MNTAPLSPGQPAPDSAPTNFGGHDKSKYIGRQAQLSSRMQHIWSGDDVGRQVERGSVQGRSRARPDCAAANKSMALVGRQTNRAERQCDCARIHDLRQVSISTSPKPAECGQPWCWQQKPRVQHVEKPAVAAQSLFEGERVGRC